MFEDHTVEQKYLWNFSKWERVRLERMQQEHLNGKVKEDSPKGKDDPLLEVRYVLNRIYFNDSRDTHFAIGPEHGIETGDVWAIRISTAFQDNNVCRDVRLESMGLTDQGASMILKTLAGKSLKMLSLKGNNLTEETFSRIDKILSEPNNQWEKVDLGEVDLKDDLLKRLKMHPQVVVTQNPQKIAHQKQGTMEAPQHIRVA